MFGANKCELQSIENNTSWHHDAATTPEFWRHLSPVWVLFRSGNLTKKQAFHSIFEAVYFTPNPTTHKFPFFATEILYSLHGVWF